MKLRLVDSEGRLFGKVNWLDGIILFFAIFTLSLFLHFARQNFLQHTTLTLESAEPRRFVPGVDRFLSVFGNGFDDKTTIRIDDQLPPSIFGVNEARIDLLLPDDLALGPHRVTVRNGKGRMVSRDDLFVVSWKPVITSIAFLESSLARTKYMLYGKYLERNCEVIWDDTVADNMDQPSSQEHCVSVPVIFSKIFPRRLSLRNPSGGLTVLEGDDLRKLFQTAETPQEAGPKLQRIIPSEIQAERETAVLLFGSNFHEASQVIIGDFPIRRLVPINQNILAAVIPPRSLPLGIHAVMVRNPNLKQDVLGPGLVVQEKGRVMVNLLFTKLSRDQMKKIRKAKKRNAAFREEQAPQILNILNERNGMIEAQVSLPVNVKFFAGQWIFLHRQRKIYPGATIRTKIFPDQLLQANVLSAPKLIRTTKTVYREEK